jgi:hypothetical protein
MDTRKIKDLRNWDKNPRSIDKEDFERLKAQIKKLGQYKPLLITKEGIVLGGNMRLKAYEELGIKEAWVSVVEAKTEERKIEYALSDNDRAGYYDEDALAELVSGMEIDLGDYKIDLGKMVSAKDVVGEYGPDDFRDTNKELDIDDMEKTLDVECPKCHFKFPKNV